jgi:hypothetical protein
MSLKSLQNIEKLGDNYLKENIMENRDDLTSTIEFYNKNWLNGIIFFFIRAFMRGRNDKLSIGYYNFTMNILEKYTQFKELEKIIPPNKIIREYKNNLGVDLRKNVMNYPIFEEIKEKYQLVDILTTDDGNSNSNNKRKLNNDRDLILVISFLNYIKNIENNNIFTHISNSIKLNGIKATYIELIDSIDQVNKKIACFLIRDFLMLFDFSNCNENKDMIYCQPVDTWVENNSIKLGIVNPKKKQSVEKQIIEICLKNNINPLKFNAGLWYLGYYRYEILFSNLEYLQNFDIK